MELKDLSKNSHFFILGINCVFLGARSLDNRTFYKGPVDNVDCLNTKYIDALFDGSYLNKLLYFNKQKDIYFYKDVYDGSADGCYHLFSDNLGLNFTHNEFNFEFIKNQIKRYNNFKKFYKKLISNNNYYFVLSLFNTITSEHKDLLEWADALDRNNVMDKTIVFGNEKYKDNFKNFIVIPVVDDFEENYNFIMNMWQKEYLT